MTKFLSKIKNLMLKIELFEQLFNQLAHQEDYLDRLNKG